MKCFFQITLMLSFLTSCSQPDHYELVIQNVRVFDGTEDLGIVNIGINADTIAALSAKDITGDSIIDGSGKFVTPGLVNAHVHITNQEQLKEGYRYGILANLNMHTGLEEREQEWKHLTSEEEGYPLLFGAGHAATVPGGHPTQYSPEMETINDSITIEEWVDHRIANKADYIKIIRESEPFMGNPALPTLSYEQIERIIDYAHQKGLLAVVHTSTLAETVEIAKMGADGFVHMPFLKNDYPPGQEQLTVIRESGAFIVPTAYMIPHGNEFLTEAPPAVRDWASKNLLSEEENVRYIRAIYEAGIPIIAGTDAPNAGLNFGDHLFNELNLYHLAGMSNLEVLRTATGNAAKGFLLPIGELKVGSIANFVLLSADPLADIKNLQEVVQVWKNGKPF